MKLLQGSSIEDFISNPHYSKYIERKARILSKYPPTLFTENLITNKDKKLHKKYLKEIADLLLKPNGNFQKFIWHLEAEEKERVEIRRKRKNNKK